MNHSSTLVTRVLFYSSVFAQQAGGIRGKVTRETSGTLSVTIAH
ncbi:MAG: hypothetical protein ACJA13_002848 [Paraglaciecola sp.]|jgi:hypothetical protein